MRILEKILYVVALGALLLSFYSWLFWVIWTNAIAIYRVDFGNSPYRYPDAEHAAWFALCLSITTMLGATYALVRGYNRGGRAEAVIFHGDDK